MCSLLWEPREPGCRRHVRGLPWFGQVAREISRNGQLKSGNPHVLSASPGAGQRFAGMIYSYHALYFGAWRMPWPLAWRGDTTGRSSSAVRGSGARRGGGVGRGSSAARSGDAPPIASNGALRVARMMWRTRGVVAGHRARASPSEISFGETGDISIQRLHVRITESALWKVYLSVPIASTAAAKRATAAHRP